MKFASPTRRLRLAVITLILAAFALQLAFILPTATPVQASEPAQAGTIPDTKLVPFGTNTFLDKEVEFWKKERTMQLINQGGIKWIKQLFAWNEIEFKKGYFNDDKNKKSAWLKYDEIVNLAAKYDVKIVARIDQTPGWANPAGGKPGGRPANFQDYADFLKAFVQHYKGKIQYITIWNEPNLEREWVPGQKVSPKDYVEMLKVAQAAIKSVDPSVRVMAAPLAITLEENINLSELKYLDEMYKAGAKDYFDLMPANAYGLEFTPEDAPNANKLNYRRVELLHEVMVKNGDANKAVWFNEYGWNASPASIPTAQLTWRRVTEQQQADYTVRGIQYAQKNWPWAGVIFVWFFRQVGDIPDSRSEQYFQLVTKDFALKPVYNSLKQEALNYLKGQNLPTPAPVTPPPPATSTPIPAGPVGTTAASTAPATGTTPNAGTVASSGNTGSTTTAASLTTIVAATPAGTVVANVPQPTQGATPASSNSAKADDNGSLVVPLIVGGVLVLGAGGGLATWAIRRRRGQP